MGPGKVTPSKKKPVSDVVMDFGNVLGEEPEDPTKDLVKDFRIDLDDYRAPEQAKELGLKMEGREIKTTPPAAAEKKPEIKEPPVQEEEMRIPIEEPSYTEPVKAVRKEEPAEFGSSSWYQAAEPTDDETGGYMPKH